MTVTVLFTRHNSRCTVQFQYSAAASKGGQDR